MKPILSTRIKTGADTSAQMQVSSFIGLSEKQAAEVKMIMKSEPAKATEIEETIGLIQSYDSVMMEWLESSPEHMQAFYDSPVEAFQKATNASDEQMESLRELASYWKADKPTISAPAQFTSDIAPYTDYTQGWDVVSAICQKEANKALDYAYAAGKLAKEFSAALEKKMFGMPVHIKVSGTFAAPSIVGGSGKYIDMALKMENIIISQQVSTYPPVDIPLDTLCLYLTTDLTCIETVRKDTGETHCEFYINFTSSEAFSKISIDGLTEELSENKFLIEEALLEALNKAADGKEHKLFEAELKILNQAPYLVPQYVRYAFVQSESNPDDNIIGALIQTNGTRGEYVQILPGTIPPQSRASLVLSNRLFVDELLRDIVVKSLRCDKNIFVSEGDPRILYNNAPFQYYEEIEGLRPTFEEVKVWIANDLLHMDVVATAVPSAGLHVKYDVKTSLKPVVKTVTDADGVARKQVICFEIETLEDSHVATADWWVWLLGALSLGIGAAFVAAILDIIEGVCPDLSDFEMTTDIGNITWNHLEVIEIKEIHLDGTMQIGCDVLSHD